MAQAPNDPVPQTAPAESKRAALIRSIGIAIFILALWIIDKLAASRVSADSVWRYIIGGAIVSVGLVALIFFTSRFAAKDP